MFSSTSFIISGLPFKSLIQFELFLCMVLGSVLISSFFGSCPVFPAPLIEEGVFSQCTFLPHLSKIRC